MVPGAARCEGDAVTDVTEAINYSDMAVVLTAWRRPGYLKKALHSWTGVRDVNSLGRFIVYADPSDRQDEILRVCADKRELLPHLEAEVNPEHYGVSMNPEFSMKRGFEAGARFVIIADDDMLVSDDILRYFKWTANKFKDDPGVAGVCAHTPEPADAGAAEDEVQLLPRYRCWIWGTWNDRFESVFEPTWDRDYSSGEPAGYDWNLDLRVIPGRGLKCVFPLASRSQNIGRFEGVHAGPADYHNTLNPSFKEKRGTAMYRMVP
jgi:hypothetical protein